MVNACDIISVDRRERMGRKRIHDFITDTHNPLVGCRHYIGRNQGVFVCDMGDMFGSWVPADWKLEIRRKVGSESKCNGWRIDK